MRVTYELETWGRFSDDKTGLLGAGLERELDMGGAAYWRDHKGLLSYTNLWSISNSRSV